MATRSVEGDHQLAEDALSQRVLWSERFQLRKHLGVAAEGKIRLNPCLDSLQPLLFEARYLGLRKRLIAKIG